MDTDNATLSKPLRLWPAVVIVSLQALLILVAALAPSGTTIFDFPVKLAAILGSIFGGLAVAVWWLLFSRAPWLERIGAIALMLVAVAATRLIVHPSIVGGMMGRMLFVFSIPVLGVALVAWAVATRRLPNGIRRAWMVVAILLACGAFTAVRTGGITGDGMSDLHWRWTPTPEELMLARSRNEPVVSARGGPAAAPAPAPPTPAAATPQPTPAAPPPTPVEPKSPERLPKPADETVETRATVPAAVTRADWPGFRGPHRDGVVRGARIETDWSRSAPVQMWRRQIGPGWSSFAVHGDVLYTQEQRGEEEVVGAYRVSTGQPVWRHGDPVRFYESNGGAGPRGTPTFDNGRVYTMGATGILNALDAGTGAVIWSRNAVKDTGRTIPDWGIASSPLVIDDVVVVAVAGQLAAYDLRTGNPRWVGTPEGGGYSSPHLITIDGVPQVVLLRGSRTTSVAPADGTLLWEHRGDPAVAIVQPGIAANGDVLIASGDAMGGNGIRRVAVSHGSAGWTFEERWLSRGLKPYFNDFVVHKGYAFGFDGSILSCIDLNDGARKWKGGRYGNGQLVLLADQDALLVTSEDGDVVLVGATPDQFKEIARFTALEGKTWNHPVVVGDVLLVRNDHEMAAFRLTLAAKPSSSSP